jgi:methyl-accepting chemotaxis protein
VDVVAVLVGIAVAVASVVLILKARRRAIDPSAAAGPTRKSSGRIDAFAVGEPWRQHVAAAQSAQRRFASIVSTLSDGPLRTRMAEIGHQVERSVDECWQIAKRGDQLDDTIRQLDGAALQSSFDRATDEGQRTSLRSQLDSLDRVRVARDQTDDRLRGLHTRLGELVSQAAEVSSGVDHTAELGTAVDDVVTQLQALNQAVDEVNNTGRSQGFEQSGPGTSASAT